MIGTKKSGHTALCNSSYWKGCGRPSGLARFCAPVTVRVHTVGGHGCGASEADAAVRAAEAGGEGGRWAAGGDGDSDRETAAEPPAEVSGVPYAA
jgi:hypothetical protein